MALYDVFCKRWQGSKTAERDNNHFMYYMRNGRKKLWDSCLTPIFQDACITDTKVLQHCQSYFLYNPIHLLIQAMFQMITRHGLGRDACTLTPSSCLADTLQAKEQTNLSLPRAPLDLTHGPEMVQSRCNFWPSHASPSYPVSGTGPFAGSQRNEGTEGNYWSEAHRTPSFLPGVSFRETSGWHTKTKLKNPALEISGISAISLHCCQQPAPVLRENRGLGPPAPSAQHPSPRPDSRVVLSLQYEFTEERNW